MVALGGAVKRADKAKLVHQSMDTVAMFSPVTKYAVEVSSPDAIAEVVSNAFRAAEHGRPGRVRQPAAGILLTSPPRARFTGQRPGADGPGSESAINDVAKLIDKAKTGDPAGADGESACQQRGAA